MWRVPSRPKVQVSRHPKVRWKGRKVSREGLKALLDRAESDEIFLDGLLKAGTVEERRRLVVEAGYDVEPSDLSTLREMAGTAELDDEELAWVAGGGTGTDITAAVSGTMVAAVVAAAAASSV